jgi:hypothetical protein
MKKLVAIICIVAMSFSLTPPNRVNPMDSAWEERFKAYYEIDSDREIDNRFVRGYANGFAFYNVYPLRSVFDNENHLISGFPFIISNPVMFFYVYETSAFVSFNVGFERKILDLLSTDELRNLSERSTHMFNLIHRWG